MIFKTGSGKETLSSEHPSCAKIKHFFYINLLRLKITWADSASGGAPPGWGRKLQLKLSLAAVRIPRIAPELALRRMVRPHGATQHKASQRPCPPRQQHRRPGTKWGSCSWLHPPGSWASAPCGPGEGSHHPTPYKDNVMLCSECSLQFLSPPYLSQRWDHSGERH